MLAGIFREVEELELRSRCALQRLFDDFVVRKFGFVTDQFPIADAEAKVARAAVVLLDVVLAALRARRTRLDAADAF